MLIRELRQEDFEKGFRELYGRFIEKMNEYDEKYCPGFNETKLEEWLGDYDFRGCFVAISNGKIVAFLETDIKDFDGEDGELVDALYLSSIYVSEECRRSGIATKLIMRAKQYAFEENINILYACIIPRNNVAKKHIEKMGFKEECEEMFVFRA